MVRARWQEFGAEVVAVADGSVVPELVRAHPTQRRARHTGQTGGLPGDLLEVHPIGCSEAGGVAANLRRRPLRGSGRLDLRRIRKNLRYRGNRRSRRRRFDRRARHSLRARRRVRAGAPAPDPPEGSPEPAMAPMIGGSTTRPAMTMPAALLCWCPREVSDARCRRGGPRPSGIAVAAARTGCVDQRQEVILDGPALGHDVAHLGAELLVLRGIGEGQHLDVVQETLLGQVGGADLPRPRDARRGCGLDDPRLGVRGSVAAAFAVPIPHRHIRPPDEQDRRPAVSVGVVGEPRARVVNQQPDLTPRGPLVQRRHPERRREPNSRPQRPRRVVTQEPLDPLRRRTLQRQSNRRREPFSPGCGGSRGYTNGGGARDPTHGRGRGFSVMSTPCLRKPLDSGALVDILSMAGGPERPQHQNREGL